MTSATRYDAYCDLLSRPDLPCLPARGKHWLCARDPLRNPETLKRDLAREYVEHRKSVFKDEGSIISVRRSPLRLVQKRSA